MSQTQLFLVAGCAVLVIGLLAHLLVGDLYRRIISLNVASGGVMLVLLALAVRTEGEPDPVPQALVLTGIVIMAAVTGMALALARRVESQAGEDEPREDPSNRGEAAS